MREIAIFYATDNMSSDVSTPQGCIDDSPAHGSAVTSLIAGTGAIAPDAQIVFYNVGTCGSNGNVYINAAAATDVWDHIRSQLESGSKYAPDIISRSLSLRDTNNAFYDPVEHCDAFGNTEYEDWMIQVDIITGTYGVPKFNSSGNSDYKTGINFPACLSNVTGVGATSDFSRGPTDREVTQPDGSKVVIPVTDTVDQVILDSNTAAHLELVAPGANISQADAFPNFNSRGTSNATPIVAGMAAVVLEKIRERSECTILPCEKIIDSIESTNEPSILPNYLASTAKQVPDQWAVDPDTGNVLELPRVNALNALGSGLALPDYTLQSSDITWFVDGFSGDLRFYTYTEAVVDSVVPETPYQITWTHEDDTQAGPRFAMSNCSYAGTNAEGLDLWDGCESIASASVFNYQLRVENTHGISSTTSRTRLIDISTPAVSFTTQEIAGSAGYQSLIQISFNRTSISGNISDLCSFDIVANGSVFDTFSTSISADPTLGCDSTELQLPADQVKLLRIRRTGADPSLHPTLCSAIHRFGLNY